MNGIPFPEMENGCPECGSHRPFNVIELSRDGFTVSIDEDGRPVDFGSPEVIEAQYSFIECLECKTTLVEDGEVVHEDLA